MAGKGVPGLLVRDMGVQDGTHAREWGFGGIKEPRNGGLGAPPCSRMGDQRGPVPGSPSPLAAPRCPQERPSPSTGAVALLRCGPAPSTGPAP